jgi:serine/threonine-protein kinase HipA
MRQATIYNNDEVAGTLIETDERNYEFNYSDDYFNNKLKPAISLNLPKIKQHHKSEVLFPFFFNMISEGENKKLQSMVLKIDENDDFGFLLKTANDETIGAIRVVENDKIK